jgi:hypothetical protein
MSLAHVVFLHEILGGGHIDTNCTKFLKYT